MTRDRRWEDFAGFTPADFGRGARPGPPIPPGPAWSAKPARSPLAWARRGRPWPPHPEALWGHHRVPPVGPDDPGEGPDGADDPDEAAAAREDVADDVAGGADVAEQWRRFGSERGGGGECRGRGSDPAGDVRSGSHGPGGGPEGGLGNPWMAHLRAAAGAFGPKGPFGPNGPFGPRGPFGGGPWGPWGPWGHGAPGPGSPVEAFLGKDWQGGHGGRRKGPRARRGDVRAGILHLLAERPMHGYEMIQELESRSGGLWKPSAGSIYPTLQLLEDEGLLQSEQRDGKKLYSLTDDGRAEVESGRTRAPWEEFNEYAEAAEADEQASPWAEFRNVSIGVATAAFQAAQAGNPDQLARVMEILKETRSRIYRVLSEDAPEAGARAAGGASRADRTDTADTAGTADTAERSSTRAESGEDLGDSGDTGNSGASGDTEGFDEGDANGSR